MSILEKMRDYQRQQEMERQAKMQGVLPEAEQFDDVQVQGLGLKPRRPSLRNLIGDNNPLADEDFEMLQQMYKFGRITE